MPLLYEELRRLIWAEEQGKHADADAILRRLTTETESEPAVLLLAAAIAVRKGDVGGGNELRRAAIASIACREADLLRSIGRLEDAKSLYHDALEIDHFNKRAADALGSLYRVPAKLASEIYGAGYAQPEIYQTPLGRYFVPPDAGDDIIVRRMKAGLFYQRYIVEALEPYIVAGSTAVDLGANLGQMSIAFCDMVGPEGQVIAVEANPYIYSLLVKNLAASGRSNWKAIHAAAFDCGGRVLAFPEPDLTANPTYGSHGFDLRKTAGAQVETIALDTMEFDRPVSAIKIDVQGSDIFAMRGARGIIERFKPAILFEYEEDFQVRFGTAWSDYADFVEEIGYRVARDIGNDYLIVPK